MTVEAICAVVACVVTVGGVLIYIGRSLGTLQSIGEAANVALKKTDQHDKDITDLKVGLIEVKTRQTDCNNCP